MQFVVHSCSIIPKTYCLERHLEQNEKRAVTVFHPNLTLRTVKFVYYFNVMLIQLQINFLGRNEIVVYYILYNNSFSFVSVCKATSYRLFELYDFDI